MEISFPLATSEDSVAGKTQGNVSLPLWEPQHPKKASREGPRGLFPPAAPHCQGQQAAMKNHQGHAK